MREGRLAYLLPVLFLVVGEVRQAAQRPAAALQAGMQLVYVSDGVEQEPWVVDSVWLDAALMDRSVCARVLLRRRPGQPPDDTRVCVRSDTLFGWDARRETWVPQRPVGPNRVFMTQRANGDTVRYATTVYTDELVSGIALRVLPTMIVTVDSLGQPKRRLQERYALALVTATVGRFEVPDSSAPAGWRTERAFALRAILGGSTTPN
jgi:hypothetical protein